MIGILGGTFNPIHFGHLRPALEVQQALNLSEIRWIPSRIPPHRAQPEVDGAVRGEMVRAAIAGQPEFVFDGRELERTGPSYTVDTLRSIRADFGTKTPLCLIMGLDAFSEFDTWHEWTSIFELAHLVVMQRPPGESARPRRFSAALQQELTSRATAHAAALHDAPGGKIIMQAVTALDISSTRIRALIAAGKSVRYLLPEAVADLIEQHGLYQQTT